MTTPTTEEIFALYPVGSTFTYLDRTMLVVRHVSNFEGMNLGFVSLPPIPAALVCDYIGDRGAVLTKTFQPETFPLLKLLNHRTSCDMRAMMDSDV